jgi:EAL domain-containing protein (putative c-di-GMP-specific phosphodiesterase class I)
VLNALRSLGLRLALDDFGTGHSSLSYLHRFPFDTIKIPAPFVQMGEEGGGMAHTQAPIIRSIVALASELDLAVIAEGVETLDEIDRLRSLNCRYAQGFAFGAAMSGADLQKKLQAQVAR